MQLAALVELLLPPLEHWPPISKLSKEYGLSETPDVVVNSPRN